MHDLDPDLLPDDGIDTGAEDELYEHHRIQADGRQEPMRLDKFLLNRLPNVSRTKVQAGIEVGAVQVNGQAAKSSYKVKPGDVVTVTLPEPPREGKVVPEEMALDIPYEDDQLLLVNKPAGMVVHPAYGNWTGTLVNGLAWHIRNLPTGRNGEIRPGLIHRIDKDTSGLLVIGKSEWAMTHLSQQFFHHTIERTYLALVWGVPREAAGTIRGNIGRHPKDRKLMTVFPEGSAEGKHAVTHYRVLQSFGYVSLVQCNLETGRTHQIRAHMKHLGHPLFADAAYGGDRILFGQRTGAYKAFVERTFEVIPRQALHAKSLGFVHPTTGENLQFETPLPEDFSAAVKRWETFAAQQA
ncbi:RluA family pseudouridine synthase [Hymenobacter busanensis]|uniref:Pseudouridine synthase n=1 Tax=Hymenobacter busanensis TaxID=2607656 RepID=A0A7L4ZZL0_9BACT|nr:RluA family pseudouridine synthase [Hymenobacter busanensis]KAA9331544.1 RluA family pseudouridine synthase [Hymenobacter busanensis]QHJ08698.1 RluA family pseudouridine synthase [Hymenobacter busanensis]